MSTALYAQEVRGVVTDSNGEPLPGVSVVVEGTTLGTQTDLDGAYVIEVPDINASNLQFIFIGMKDQIIPVNGRTVIDVVMEEDVTRDRRYRLRYSKAPRPPRLRIVHQQRENNRAARDQRIPGPDRKDGRCVGHHH